MNEFPRVPASKQSLANRKKVVGHGVNDAWYMVYYKAEGIKATCPAYAKWSSMMHRSYHHSMIEKRPSYKNVTVCNEWLTFSNFLKWFEDNYIKGFELDKDIKVKGSKVYSPETCLFVTQAVNCLLTDHAAARGNYQQGVDFKKSTGRFRARVNSIGGCIDLGYFSTALAASKAYKMAKNKQIEIAMKENESIACYLKQHLYNI